MRDVHVRTILRARPLEKGQRHGTRRNVSAIAPRTLSRAHFAFMRALLQGLDERESFDRYLWHGEGANDLRTVRHAIQWIRDEFAAAAHRAARPGTARLVLMDPERFDEPVALPSLEEFALARGLEDFSEAEQAEAYADAYPRGAAGVDGGGPSRRVRQRPSHRARVIARQLEALRWLEGQLGRKAQGPRSEDNVAVWLNPLLAARLERAGLSTLATLTARINLEGARWWRVVPGIGALKARRVVDWLRSQESDAALRLVAHVAVPRQAVPQATLAAVVPAATALVPLEKLLIPPALDGGGGHFRAPPGQCRLTVRNDRDAINAWLAAKAGKAETRSDAREDSRLPIETAPPRQLGATHRAYRKEAERLLLWCVLEKRKPMSSLTAEDAQAYFHFLAQPPAHWCGPRHYQRWSPQWRPMEGALSTPAQRHALTILRALFGFLSRQNYVVNNPFTAVALPASARAPLGSTRTFTVAQWAQLDAALTALEHNEQGRRLARAIRWLYATGLRLSELTGARCGDLERTESLDEGGATVIDWTLSVTGRYARPRRIAVPPALVSALDRALRAHGRLGGLSDPGIAEIPLVARFEDGKEPVGWSSSGLHKAIKAALDRMAGSMKTAEANPFRKASAQWLRHSHAVHALQGGPGTNAVPIAVVQKNLGHASVQTTSGYLASAAASRIDAIGASPDLR